MGIGTFLKTNGLFFNDISHQIMIFMVPSSYITRFLYQKAQETMYHSRR